MGKSKNAENIVNVDTDDNNPVPQSTESTQSTQSSQQAQLPMIEIANILHWVQTAHSRGAYKLGEELTAVESTYNSVKNFLDIANQVQQNKTNAPVNESAKNEKGNN